MLGTIYDLSQGHTGQGQGHTSQGQNINTSQEHVHVWSSIRSSYGRYSMQTANHVNWYYRSRSKGQGHTVQG